jgi:hypothetical protein
MGVVEGIQMEIEARRLPGGGWASGIGSRASVETTCYALMALHDRRDTPRDHAIDLLLRVQNRDGSWPAFEGDDAEGCWTTALALIALRFVTARRTGFERSLTWLLENKGLEGHWFWKWKFKTVDRAVQFNPDKFGWPWFPGTVSWVIPTAFALIALRQCCTGEITNRIKVAKEMLRDRACRQGGWNAGNGIVFGAALAPHIDSTAIALLALADRTDATALQAVDWLREASIDCSSIYSLSWTVLASLIYGHTNLNRSVVNLYRALSAKSAVSNVEALSLAVIAINAVQGNGNPFMVV